MFPVAAVDFGGTHIRAAYFPDEKPQPGQRTKEKTYADEGSDAVIKRIVGAIHSVLPSDHDGLRIGIASPGPLNPFTGIIFDTPNLPGWENVPLADEISAHFSSPVVINNDANLAALGEWKHGAGRGVDDIVYLTISTGIGGGVISQGQLFLGASGLAAELGHMKVVAGGPECGCGQYGHIEAIASGPSITRIARERLHTGEVSILSDMVSDLDELQPEMLGQAADNGDKLALSVIENAGNAIGSHLASLVHAFNPARIVIGGGVSQLGDLLFTPIRQTLADEIIHPAYSQNLEVKPAELGDDAGLIGAMILARQN
jgi:glucokinase